MKRQEPSEIERLRADIVKRLRNFAATDMVAALREEAAAEIEWLQAELELAEAEIEHMTTKWSNNDAAHRHAAHALEDFCKLRAQLGEREQDLWHSLSHHLRHAVYRTGEGARHRTYPDEVAKPGVGVPP
jgi:hypothetical protein